MASCDHVPAFQSLDLPAEYQDLEGLLQADLRAIVTMLTQRAHERLFLTGREHADLQQALWNGLADAVNAAMEPLSVENR